MLDGARSRRAGRQALPGWGEKSGPVIILDRPQLGENIGFAARAMLNCGLASLRLVAPREGWPNRQAVAAAAGATAVLDAVVLFETVSDAVADLARIYAATARPRDMVKPVMTPRAAAADMRMAAAAGGRIGVLFGRERSGLENDDVARADVIIEAPLNPAFSSLNLAQAVLLCAYEWWTAADTTPAVRRGRASARTSAKRDLENLFVHLESELDAVGFLYPPEKRPRMVRNIRNMLIRAGLTEQEVRTLRGIVTALARGRR